MSDYTELLRYDACVYFVRHEKGFYKIGYSKLARLRSRVSELRSSSPFRIELHYLIDTHSPDDAEKAIHDMFWRDRVQGEWFDIEEEKLLGKMAKMGLHPVGDDYPKVFQFARDSWEPNFYAADNARSVHSVAQAKGRRRKRRVF